MEALVIADKEEFKEKRPPCPECGSLHIYANGISWLCCHCGKQFTKIRRTEKKEIINRPKCIECGSSEIISRGTDWQCKACGRRFAKQNRKK
jgi:ribosomal protein L37AE/L43A